MSDGTEDEVDERLSRRFDSGQNASDDSNSKQSSSDVQTSNASSASNSKHALHDKGPVNVKKAWNTRSVYLPEEIDDDLTLTFEELRLQARQSDEEFLPQKTRHYYPVLVELGRQQIAEMETDEFADAVDEIL
jgi:hypothetical protein